MSLGFARDSIADLQSLALGNFDEEPNCSVPPSTTFVAPSAADGDFEDDFGPGIDFDAESGADPGPHTFTSLQNEGSKDTGGGGNTRQGMTRSNSYRSLVKDIPPESSVPPVTSQKPLRSTVTPTPSPQRKNKDTYSGFSYPDYDDDYYAAHHQHHRKHHKKKNVLTCIFPFLVDPLGSESEDDGSTAESEVESDKTMNAPQQSLGNSPPSHVPSSTTSPTPISNEAATNVENTVSVSPTPSKTGPKSILKRTIVKPLQPTTQSGIHAVRNNQVITGSRRRNILPSYEPSLSTTSTLSNLNSGNNRSDGISNNVTRKKVTFSAMARVKPVLARADMTFYQKSLVWWQRNDYDDFKKTGRIIAKAMLQGGSEIWLQTNNAWGRKQSQNSSSSTKNSPEHVSGLKKYGVNIQNDEEEKSAGDSYGDKWWCKFGHSRRGLEHVVSIAEGRQRQKLVNASISAVVDEQRRQRMMRKDHKKIASISMQYTSWAKDLALAAGAADAETVRSNFHSKAMCRLAHLSNKLVGMGKLAEGQPSANFILSANPALKAKVLDSHTHSSISSKKSDGLETKSHQLHTMKKDISHKAAGFQFQETKEAQL